MWARDKRVYSIKAVSSAPLWNVTPYKVTSNAGKLTVVPIVERGLALCVLFLYFYAHW